MKTIYREMQVFWDQSHLVRALGAYLLGHTRSKGLPSEVKTGLRAEVKRGGQLQETLVF